MVPRLEPKTTRIAALRQELALDLKDLDAYMRVLGDLYRGAEKNRDTDLLAVLAAEIGTVQDRAEQVRASARRRLLDTLVDLPL